MKKKTTEEFIIEAKNKHGNVYDYSKVIYTKKDNKVIIICITHGEFEQCANSHLQGYGCKKCATENTHIKQRCNTTDFIKKAKEIHGDKYDYSKVEYINVKIPIVIICNSCNNNFEQIPNTHLRGSGCKICANVLRIENSKIHTTETIIQKATEIHGNNYDYSKVEYTGIDNKIIIICKTHGEFKQSPDCHINRQNGCKKCAIISGGIKRQHTKDNIIEKSKDIHGDKYDYSKLEYTGIHNKIIIICKKHGEFKQNANAHIRGSGCTECIKNIWSTEKIIEKSKYIHGDKYDYSKVEYTGIDNKIIIICKKHGEFKQSAYSHMKGHSCPICKPNFSKKQIEWLSFVSKYNNINIQHALNGNEYIIPTTKYKADGYCNETNTIYEFHGDLWHGNPKLYDENNTSYFGIKYGELYKKTLEKEQIIKNLGYKLIVMWEYDWDKIKKSVKILQRIFRNSKFY